MSQNSPIEWTDATWTPIRARVKPNAGEIAAARGYTSLIQIATKMQGHVGPHCEKVSPGCEGCYSETNGLRCLPSNGTGLPFDRRSRDLVDIFVDQRILTDPFHWKRPRRIFACSQTDWCAEFVTDEMRDRMLAVAALTPRHTYQFLTKRAENLEWYATWSDICSLTEPRDMVDRIAIAARETLLATNGEVRDFRWPLPNVWMGVSVESRDYLWRIDHLRRTSAAIRFLSLEPLLEDLGDIDLTGIHWVIVGGESGKNARPMHPEWVQSIQRQCAAAGVKFFFKQWGQHAPASQVAAPGPITHAMTVEGRMAAFDRESMIAADPHALRWEGLRRAGKKKAGRELDGRAWDEMPEATSRK